MRLDDEERGGVHYRQQIERLMPADDACASPDEQAREQEAARIRDAADQVARVALPSVIELLQRGFWQDASQEQKDPQTALSDGMPKYALSRRHVRLRYQHRMHHTISAFPRDRFYTDPKADDAEDAALLDATNVHDDRQWDYQPDEPRAVWLHVDTHKRGDQKENPAEVRAVLAQLRHFAAWAALNPRDDGKPWEVAVLTFYRAQERLLRVALRREAGSGAYARFELAGGAVTVALGTVDRFQGHEADLVLLSMARRQEGVGFLDSPNRLNVALTRARYRPLVVVGYRNLFAEGKHRSDDLRALATTLGKAAASASTDPASPLSAPP